MNEVAPENPDIDSDLPSNEEIYDRVFRRPYDPVGISPEPAIGGWLSADSIDDERWLAAPELEHFDPGQIRSSEITLYPPGIEPDDAPD